jgi:hypothetical protein
MHILDPLRPRNAADLPMLVWQGQGVAIVPTVMVQMYADGKAHFSIMALINPTTGRYFYDSVEVQHVGTWFDSWWNDPEGKLASLHWAFSSGGLTEAKAQAKPRSPSPVFSLEDLGL